MAWCLEHKNAQRYTKIHAGDLVWAAFRSASFLDNKALAPDQSSGTRKTDTIEASRCKKATAH